MNTFMIIDDDITVVKMIGSLIKKHELGKVVEELYSSEHAVKEVLFYNPDILLIDYLITPMDGVSVIQILQERGYYGKIIMISQVEDVPMISKAYHQGIEFFISKPINAIEVVKVIKNVSYSLELERSLNKIKSALSSVVHSSINIEEQEYTIKNILMDLGIIGELGCQDLIKVIEEVKEFKKKNSQTTYRLQDIYEKVVNRNKKMKNDSNEKNMKSFEQRIRRTIQKALENLAQLGMDDYYNPIFIEYASLLFDLTQVKQEMKYLEGLSHDRGRINIKKFIEGILTKINM
ncbi:response regulator [Garciella nitratireducens]|uniref:Stage 0 sporulation protein A homolog n=1 Tax=Garciella nitratireducens DSM 15102 TaxID=1121911 RepID=A0A1T4LWC7_9FIRM|nr:response regulator [Garciella nitratireducens]SJZ58788.1 two-component system, response regulator YcbB [Garciella nitratireducens DSM 15102]